MPRGIENTGTPRGPSTVTSMRWLVPAGVVMAERFPSDWELPASCPHAAQHASAAIVHVRLDMTPPPLPRSNLTAREVVLHFERARPFDGRARLEVRFRSRRILRLHARPEPGRGEPARFQIGILVAVLEERGLLHLADEIPRDRARPDARELRLPQLAEEPRAAQDVALFRQTQACVKNESGRLHRSRGTIVRCVQRGDPLLRRTLA